MTQIIGVDPGPDTGLLSLFPHDGTVTIRALQVDAGSVVEALWWLHDLANKDKTTKTIIAHERYVIRPTTHKTSNAAANQITRDLNGRIAGLATALTMPAIAPVMVVETRAVDVKRWASEERLRATEVWKLTKGMRHARSAAWHALHTAVFRCGWPDPLELSAGAPWVPQRPRPVEYGANINVHVPVWR